MASDSSLKSKVFKGISWLALSKALGQLFTFVTTAILARLLSPADFGLMGIALIFTNFMDVLNKFGVPAAIVQRKDMNDDILSTTFWPNLLIGFLMFTITFILSGNIAGFLGAPAARGLIGFIALSMIIDSFGLVQSGLLRRKLNFRQVSLVSFLSSVGSGLIAVICAFSGLGVWSLAVGNVAGSIIGAFGFWFSVQWRPSLKFYWKYFKEIYVFGLKVFANGIVEFFRGNSDFAFVGKALGSYNLGIYTLSYNIATLAQNRITNVVRDALLPAYSMIQDEHKRLQDAASKAAQYLALVVFPMSFGLLAIAPEFIRLVYGSKWEEAIIPAQILLVGGSLLAINPVIEKIFIAVGKPGVFAVWNAIRTVFLIGAIYIGLRLGGIVGVAWGVTLSILVYTPITHIISFHYIGGSVWRLWKELGVIVVPSVMMALGVFWFKPILTDLFSSKIILLFAETLLGVVIYLTIIMLLNPPALRDMLSLLTKLSKERLAKFYAELFRR